MLDEKSTKTRVRKEASYFSKWIEEREVEKFVFLMRDKIDEFEALEQEGYDVDIDIEIFDRDCFDEKDVVIVLISMTADTATMFLYED